jgi:hypothetical protein
MPKSLFAAAATMPTAGKQSTQSIMFTRTYRVAAEAAQPQSLTQK